MDLGEKIPADDPARHDGQHEEQRDGRVKRIGLEVRVKDDRQRAHDAEKHMGTEPCGHPAKAKEAGFLAHRIKQQGEHHQRANDTQPVAEPRIGADIFFVAVDPAEIKSGYHSRSEKKRAHP